MRLLRVEFWSKWIQLLSLWTLWSMFFFAILLGIAEIVSTIWRLSVKSKGKKEYDIRRIWMKHIHEGLLLISFCLIGYGIYQAVKIPEVTRINLVLKGMASDAVPLKIAVLADLHADMISDRGRIEAIVEKTNALEPDLVVIAGDFVDGRPEEFGRNLEALQFLNAKYGVYGVPGNHEYYSGYGPWMKFLEGLGIRMLLNDSVVLEENHVVVAGVTDPAARRKHEAEPDFDLALEKAPDNLPVILLCHQPKLAGEAAGRKVALQISGHTHGGMVWGLKKLVARFNNGFVSGLYQLDDTTLLVSNGTGIWSGFPIRIGCPSEIILLTCLPDPEAAGTFSLENPLKEKPDAEASSSASSYILETYEEEEIPHLSTPDSGAIFNTEEETSSHPVTKVPMKE